MCPLVAQLWKLSFVHLFKPLRGRLCRILACWSNGTIGKASIVVFTMNRLCPTALREKSPWFVFFPSWFLTLAVTFPSTRLNIPSICPLAQTGLCFLLALIGFSTLACSLAFSHTLSITTLGHIILFSLTSNTAFSQIPHYMRCRETQNLENARRKSKFCVTKSQGWHWGHSEDCVKMFQSCEEKKRNWPWLYSVAMLKCPKNAGNELK